MIGEVIGAIAQKLDSAFGDWAIYTENVEQTLCTPCFIVQLIAMMPTPFLGTRKHHRFPFDILYYPDSTSEPRAEILPVQDRMLEALETIRLADGTILRGTEMHCETVDNIGHLLVDYCFFTIRPNDTHPMEELEVIQHAK